MTTHPDLSYEQARNQEYLAKLEKKLSFNSLRPASRGARRTAPVNGQAQDAGYYHPLIGRVGCDTSDGDLTDFYLGPRFVDDGDMRVYSWAAPVARLFYEPDTEGSEDVVVRRTYEHHVYEIVDLDDEWAHEAAQSPFVPRELSVPAPSRPSTTGRRRTSTASWPSNSEVDPDGDVRSVRSAVPSSARLNDQHSRRAQSSTAGMRAKDAVLKRLAAPRQERLVSILALLQADQYALVSWPVDQSLVIQGHPGTGKTIVAAYRAAYLTDPALHDKGGALYGMRPLRVLVVGPTEGYVNHVGTLIGTLADTDGVRVTHLAELLRRTTGLKVSWPGPLGGEHDDVDPQARALAERAARILEGQQAFRTGPSATRANLKLVYELVASNGSTSERLATDPSVVAWMKKLPPFEQAFKRRYLPFMAQCRLAYKAVAAAERYDHIIVDEAQDVSPIEWNVLDQYLKRGGVWTLVGDINQRRSDSTYGSWQEIADHLALAEEGRFAPQVMQRGYRSTGAILSFADKLLPTAQRGNQSIQAQGEPVRIERVTRSDGLAIRAITLATELSAKYDKGTTAIITVDPGSIMKELGRSGWRRPGSALGIWRRDGVTLRLFVPEDARGLEFDAVVVVEPGDFPENLGRTGQLYTSLTRANRELAVVWHRGLPDALRRFARA